MDPENPLDPKHCECLDECLRKNREARRLIERLQRAGVDVTHLEEENNKRKKLAESIKAEFFPYKV